MGRAGNQNGTLVATYVSKERQAKKKTLNYRTEDRTEL